MARVVGSSGEGGKATSATGGSGKRGLVSAVEGAMEEKQLKQ